MTLGITLAPTASGVNLTGTTTVTLNASGTPDFCELTVDGVAKGSPDVSKPYVFLLDTTKIPDGAHVLRGFATYKSLGIKDKVIKNITIANGSPPPVSLVSISGNPVQGQVLTAVPSPAGSYTYKWRRCDAQGLNPVDIPGATSSTYTLVLADVGQTIRVVATGSQVATSAATTVVTAAPMSPSNTSPPTVVGTPTVGLPLSSAQGAWIGTSPITYAYQWQRCDALGANPVDIPGATSATYALTSADVGHTLRLKVTATNSVGSTSTTSPASAVIADVSGFQVTVVTLPKVGNSEQAFFASGAVALDSALTPGNSLTAVINGVLPTPPPPTPRPPVVNTPTLVAILSGSVMTTLVFNKMLSRGDLPNADFAMTLASSPIPITKVYASENRVTIWHWGSKVTNNAAVTVTYSGVSIVSVSGQLAAKFTSAVATTGPATLHSTSNLASVHDDPTGGVNTTVYRGSTAVGLCPLIVGQLHTHPPAVELETKWLEAADKYGLAIAIPDDGAFDSNFGMAGDTEHYGGYINGLPARILNWCTKTGADPNKVFLAGYSGSAGFFLRCAKARNNAWFPLAGVAVQSGIINRADTPTMVRDRPLPLLLSFGTGDQGLAAGKLSVPPDPSDYYSQQEILHDFAVLAGTGGSTELFDTIGNLAHSAYDGNVRGIIVNGGTHVWPGGTSATGNNATYSLTDLIAQWAIATATPIVPDG